MDTVRWGIIGCGNVTEVKSGPGFQKARDSSLVAVMRRNGDLAKDYAQRHSVPKWYDDAQALIDDPDVNAIYIATPPSSHKVYTIMAAQAGKPVYVEKPMALNFAECQEMIGACQEAAVPLFVAYYRRSLARFLKIKELLDAGAIGEVRFVSITFTNQHALRSWFLLTGPGACSRRLLVGGSLSIWRRINWIFSTTFSVRSRPFTVLPPTKQDITRRKISSAALFSLSPVFRVAETGVSPLSKPLIAQRSLAVKAASPILLLDLSPSC